jgi:class 3 adenylate cyclase
MELRELEALGLYDPDADDADERAALLAYLSSQGVTAEQMVAADREHRLPFVLGDLAISPGDAELTIEEVAERLGATPDTVNRIWSAFGFARCPPGERRFAEADVRVLQVLSVVSHYFGEAQGVQFARSVGSAMARVAETGFTLALANVEDGFLPRAESLVAAAQSSALLGTMTEAAPMVFDVVFRHHIELVVRRWDASLPDDPSTITTTVGFADLVGFTSLSRSFTAAEVSAALTDLESLALDATSTVRGRLVKLIGDEIMFVAPDPDAGCEVALALLDGASAHAVLPSLRASLAAGTVVPFEGDYYGPVVNLASRLVDAAPPDGLLVTTELAGRLDPARFTSADRRRLELKGFPEPVTVCTIRAAG